MVRFWCLLSAALVSSGCGYIGEPLPPALHIPQPVVDLSAIERGSKIFVQFTLPSHTTENLEIRKPVTAQLGIRSYSVPVGKLGSGRENDPRYTGQ